MRAPVLEIERVIISHWHADHSGGLLSLMKFRNEVQKRESATNVIPLVADLHPNRPTARGFAPPPSDKAVFRLPEDPSFAAIEALRGVVEKHAEPHIVAGGGVYVSGEIPRVTDFEQGLVGGLRWSEGENGSGHWIPDPVRLYLGSLCDSLT